VIATPCDPLASPTAEQEYQYFEQLSDESLWPSCATPNIAWSSASSGLFVNLEAIGKTEGCFRGDCSYSDHFASSTADECSQACASLRSCHWWTFWESRPSSCWLRNSVASLENRQDWPGVLSGASNCSAPTSEGDQTSPTIMDILLGATGTVHPGLWEEWNLIEVLEAYGDKTVAEVRRLPATAVMRAALRAAAALGGDTELEAAEEARVV